MASSHSRSRSMPQNSIPRPSSRGQVMGTIGERLRSAAAPPAIPRKSSQRKSTGALRSLTDGSRTSQETGASAPPAYEWVPAPIDEKEDGRLPVEGEQLAALRRGEGWRRPARGGWGRIMLIAGILFLLVLGLAVGLGVGLSQRNSNNNKSSSSSPGFPTSEEPPQKFPLGQYSFVTTLSNVETACVSNTATWSCYPGVEYNPSTGGSESTGMAYFNWAINNTESNYATPDSVSSTPSSGIAANLTVSATSNPFGLTFNAKPLTYYASSSNNSSPRYQFSFTVSKMTIPDPTVSSDGSASECYFSDTTFSGTIYLSASRNYPTGSLANSKSIGGYEQWPHAVEITQVAHGGSNVPKCYEGTNGAKGTPITGFTAQSANSECLCDYRNYF